MARKLPKEKGQVTAEALEEQKISSSVVADHEELAKKFLEENVAAIADVEKHAKAHTETYLLSDDEMWALSGKILQYCEAQSGMPLYEYQRAFARRIVFSVISEDAAMITSLWARQCLDKDTIVLSRDGSACRIEDHPDAWCTGHEPVFRVRTSSGVYARATANHPFLTDRGWVRTDELVPGDWLCVLDTWDRLGDRCHEFTGLRNECTVVPALDGEDGEKRAWVMLAGVDPDGEADVWDMTVPDKGWFFANGIAVHNSGKTETVAQVITGLIIILPLLTSFFNDPRISKFKNGVWVGIFGPTYELAGIMYNRMRSRIFSRHAQEVLSDPEIGMDLSSFKGRALQFPNGSFIDVQSAGPGSKIEGKTYHIVLVEESQDVPNTKLRKSIAPMLAATAGTKVKIGTPNPDKNDFFDSCVTNESRDAQLEVDLGEKAFERSRCHFAYDFTYAAKANPRYAKYIQAQIEELGFDSDDFRMSYRIQWLIDRNRFLTPDLMDQTGLIRGATLKWIDEETDELKSTFQVSGMVQNDGVVEGDIVVGADFGKSRSSTVLTAAKVWLDHRFYDGQDVRYRAHIVDWLEIEGDDHDKQHDTIIEWLERFPGLYKFIGDATGKGDPIMSRLKAVLEARDVVVVPFIFSTSSKHIGYSVYHKELSAGRFTYPYAKQTRSRRVRRFRQQHIDLKKTWRGRFMVVEKQDNDPSAKDDYCDSGMLCCYGINVNRSGPVEQADENPFLSSTRHGLVAARRSRAVWATQRGQRSERAW